MRLFCIASIFGPAERLDALAAERSMPWWHRLAGSTRHAHLRAPSAFRYSSGEL
jgi:hypothetical protein